MNIEAGLRLYILQTHKSKYSEDSTEGFEPLTPLCVCTSKLIHLVQHRFKNDGRTFSSHSISTSEILRDEVLFPYCASACMCAC